ncbi:hypothetical protein JX266_001136 [Neoarthrinium moseri]|nr:hypothetical protein JX266_001136 [Neoarthrinium moseri]
MAAPILATDRPKAPESDYGSDFSVEEERLVLDLLERLQGVPAASASSPDSQLDSASQADLDAAIAADLFVLPPVTGRDPEHVCEISNRVGFGAHLPVLSQAKALAGPPLNSTSRVPENVTPVTSSLPLDGIRYPDLSRALSDSQPESAAKKTQALLQSAQPKGDTRSPIERFRSFPKKPLTVTDISSGAWCELQYWYTLSLLPGGRKTRTAAMRGGTRVHQKLEDEVHTTIQVNVTSKEEAFALRLWNFIQGLRTLRDTGLTRELEVWGVVEEQVINGVIDELSFTSPNAGFEEELNHSPSSIGDAAHSAEKQSPITNYFNPHHRRVYLTDIKTRGSTRLPSGAALRPSRVQLFLYHRMLGEMAAGRLDFATIVARYGLQPEARFSDVFMAQIGSLYDEVFNDACPDEAAVSTIPMDIDAGVTDSNTAPSSGAKRSLPLDLIRYRSIQHIIPLVQAELHETFPLGTESIGDLVAVVYRHRDDGRIIGNHTFPTDPEALSNYLKLDLAWWLGKRNPDGVSIEEAYKCRICEFAERCDWRQERDDEIVRRSKKQMSNMTTS